ncbi:unnamed protein product [Tilletia caries]|uniref:Uncharacterized protein n=1 Tax=Tilletia caries TaxID=13290 RepID=A0A8T8SFD4_9BASI|nr:hypothetical protein CF335_g8781 [Tilletia laevis]KAE8186418.1 hypothetical protein CF336_g6998 [Tilletia laevis]KAE8238474.1 hypothetical protein A4X03_0g8853 [Tilletia caries]CAD6954093.1 unnamed protein product [Tilletia caries]
MTGAALLVAGSPAVEVEADGGAGVLEGKGSIGLVATGNGLVGCAAGLGEVGLFAAPDVVQGSSSAAGTGVGSRRAGHSGELGPKRTAISSGRHG